MRAEEHSSSDRRSGTCISREEGIATVAVIDAAARASVEKEE